MFYVIKCPHCGKYSVTEARTKYTGFSFKCRLCGKSKIIKRTSGFSGSQVYNVEIAYVTDNPKIAQIECSKVKENEVLRKN